MWQNGGPYFGVPLTNFAGWFLCVFTFYFVFALYLRATMAKADVTAITTRGYWVLGTLAYASMSLEVWGSWLLGKGAEITDKAGQVWHAGDIYGSMVLVNVFTMILVSLLALVLISREISPTAQRQP